MMAVAPSMQSLVAQRLPSQRSETEIEIAKLPRSLINIWNRTNYIVDGNRRPRATSAVAKSVNIPIVTNPKTCNLKK